VPNYAVITAETHKAARHSDDKIFLSNIALSMEWKTSPVFLAMLIKAATRSDGIHTLYNLEHTANLATPLSLHFHFWKV
jgi:hypothetical protein